MLPLIRARQVEQINGKGSAKQQPIDEFPAAATGSEFEDSSHSLLPDR
jgi:hypothetical protein